MSDPVTFRCDIEPSDPERIRAIVESTGVFSPMEVVMRRGVGRRAAGEGAGERLSLHLRRARRQGHRLRLLRPDRPDPRQLRPLLDRRGPFGAGGRPRAAGVGGGGAADSRRGRASRLHRDLDPASLRATRGFYERCAYHLEVVLKDFYAPGDGKAIYVKAL